MGQLLLLINRLVPPVPANLVLLEILAGPGVPHRHLQPLLELCFPDSQANS